MYHDEGPAPRLDDEVSASHATHDHTWRNLNLYKRDICSEYGNDKDACTQKVRVVGDVGDLEQPEVFREWLLSFQ